VPVPLEFVKLRADATLLLMSEEKGEFEVKCPKCKSRVKVKEAEAEASMKVKCKCGEVIELAKGFGV
jgi:phage FluMu protein Com